MTCPCCHGARQLRWFVELKIKWKSHKNEHIVEHGSATGLPDNLVKRVHGTPVADLTAEAVLPLAPSPNTDEALVLATQQLVKRHNNAVTVNKQKQLMQRLLCTSVPVSACRVNWGKNATSVFVYGTERNCHIPDGAYPETCCWGCTIA